MLYSKLFSKKGLLVLISLFSFLIPSTAGAGEAKKALKGGSHLIVSGQVGDIVDNTTFKLLFNGGQIAVDTNGFWPEIFSSEAEMAVTQLHPGMKVLVSGIVKDPWLDYGRLQARYIVSREGDDLIYYDYKRPSALLTNIDKMLYPDLIRGGEQGLVSVIGTITKDREKPYYQVRYGAEPEHVIRVNVTGVIDTDFTLFSVGDNVILTGKLDTRTEGEKREIHATRIERIQSDKNKN